MGVVGAILTQLEKSRSRLEAVLSHVLEANWQQAPRPDAWSPAEVVAHLISVEETVTSTARRLIQNEPRPAPFWKRVRLPVVLVQYRVWRRKTPLPLDRSLVGPLAGALARLSDTRGAMRAFLEKNDRRDLSLYRWPHPFLGSLDFYDWFRLLAHHEIRHAKQIREIIEYFHA